MSDPDGHVFGGTMGGLPRALSTSGTGRGVSSVAWKDLASSFEVKLSLTR